MSTALLKFRLLSFLSWNTLSRKHDVGILQSAVDKRLAALQIINRFLDIPRPSRVSSTVDRDADRLRSIRLAK